MVINGYEITKRFFTKKSISFFEAVHTESNQPYIFRLLDGEELGESAIEAWYDLYDSYQLTVTNFQHLPQVHKIDSKGNKVYTIFTHHAGKPLEDAGKLKREQAEQLLEAVWHLHKKNMIHGAIVPENIHITPEEKVILYGAGEWKGKRSKVIPKAADDVAQLAEIFRKYGIVQSTAQPVTIEQLQEMVRMEVIPGLVEKENPKPESVAKPPAAVEKEDHSHSESKQEVVQPKVQTEEKREESPVHKEEIPETQENSQDIQDDGKDSKKNPSSRMLVIGLVIGALIAGGGIMAMNIVKETPAVKTDSTIEKKEKAESNKVLVAAQGITGNDIEKIMEKYEIGMIHAINNNDFSIVEPFLIPNSKLYHAQKELVTYLNKKGVREKLIDYNIKTVKKLDENRYSVVVYEQYEITYRNTGEVIGKNFENTYTVEKREGFLGVSDIQVNEVEQKVLKSPVPSSVYQGESTIQYNSDAKNLDTYQKPTGDYSQDRYVGIKTVEAYIRTGPTINSDTMMIADETMGLRYLDEGRDETGMLWLYVETPTGVTGWISSKVVAWIDPQTGQALDYEGSEEVSSRPLEYLKVTDGRANIRISPTIQAQSVGLITPEVPLRYMYEKSHDETGQLWLKVQTPDGLSGWMRTDVIQWILE